ncbi:hypothetical protein, partial [Hydrogenophaga taeniospiralis]|uniref:hypothetical protein n=1 Tax=Hydrogenophaga taeniospiralis TaxID=65656 RepID=UPI001C3F69E5
MTPPFGITTHPKSGVSLRIKDLGHAQTLAGYLLTVTLSRTPSPGWRTFRKHHLETSMKKFRTLVGSCALLLSAGAALVTGNAL